MQKMLNATLGMNIILFFMIEMQNLKKTEEQGKIGRFRLGECNIAGNRLIEVCEDNYSGD